MKKLITIFILMLSSLSLSIATEVLEFEEWSDISSGSKKFMVTCISSMAFSNKESEDNLYVLVIVPESDVSMMNSILEIFKKFRDSSRQFSISDLESVSREINKGGRKVVFSASKNRPLNTSKELGLKQAQKVSNEF